MKQQAVYVDNPRGDVRPFIDASARSVLDVGCGRGGFGRTLREVLGPSAHIVGVEAVMVQAERARESGAFSEVRTGYFPEALGESDERFDQVFFNDVLEHIYDPWALLREIPRHLAPNGQVVAVIPNIQYWPVIWELVKGRWDYADAGTLDRTHVRFFTRATMIEAFVDAGFEVLRCEPANRYFGGQFSKYPLRALKPVLGNWQWLHFVVVARKAVGDDQPRVRTTPIGSKNDATGVTGNA
ncbi:MAG: class I SAM-dependent methyltransferase [Nostocoides sp.]